VSISSDGEQIALLDTHNTFYLYCQKTLEQTLKKRVVKLKDPMHLYHKGSALSSKMDIFLSSKNSGNALLVNLKSSPVLREKFNHNKRAIYSALFSHDSSMLAFGGEDGRFYLYDEESADVRSLIGVQSDYIAAICFSLDKRLIAISSFSKKTILYDTLKHKEIATIELPVTAEVIAFSSDREYLLLLSREKIVYKYMIQSAELIESSFELAGWATTILMLEGDFCLVGTRSNNLYIVNHKEFYIVDVISLQNSGITDIHKQESTLVIGFATGEVFLIDMNAYIDEFTMHLSLYEFDRAAEYLEHNRFLYLSSAMKIFDTEWKKVLEEAKYHLVKNEQTQAHKLVSPFFFDAQKKREYDACRLNAPVYSRFLLHMQAFRYADAYNLVESSSENDFLKHTKEYKRLEKEWFVLYKEAKSMLMKNSEDLLEEVKRKLQPFMSIKSKRALVLELLKNYKIFQLSDSYVRSRNFKAYFELVAKYEFLEMEEVYKKVLEIGQSTYTRLIDLEQNQKLSEAIEIATFLLDFTPMRTEVSQTLTRLKQKQELQNYCEKKNIKAVYEYIQKHPNLENNKIFEEFHEIFLAKLLTVKALSQRGEVQKILSMLREYVDLRYTREAIGYYLRQAYIKEILLAYESSDAYLIDFEKSIALFYSYFGRHSDIFTSFQNANISEEILLTDMDKLYPEDAYITKEFESTILVKM